MVKIIKHNGKKWMPIPNFENYFVSKDGQILSFAGRCKPHLMNPMTNQSGYLYVYLYDGSGNQTKCFIHRAVLMAWVGMPKDGEETRHLNDIPTDNRLENLCWGNRFENVADKFRNDRVPLGEDSPSHKLTENDVLEIRKLHGVLPLRRIAEIYGVTHTTIRKAALGIRWKNIKSDKYEK